MVGIVERLVDTTLFPLASSEVTSTATADTKLDIVATLPCAPVDGTATGTKVVEEDGRTSG